MSKSPRIIFFGTSNFAVHHLSILLFHKYKIVGVFTQPDRPCGRGKKITLSPVKLIAKNKGIPIFQPASLLSKENQNCINKLNADIIIVVEYGLILPEEIINIPYFGCINVHASLLPRWRGAAPIQRSLLAGDTITGITIIQINSKLDSGNILHRAFCPISEQDTSFTLYTKLVTLGQKSLIETLQKILKKQVKPEIQDESLVTYAKKLTKNEAYINWFFSASQIERCIRAFNPWPVSWIKINKQPVKIWKASVLKKPSSEKPGTIIQFNKSGIQVCTGENILILERLQLAGKKPISVQEFLNSHYQWLNVGMRLS